MTPGRCCRAVRAAVFAAVCVLLGTLGHVLMSGVAVPWWATVPASAMTGAVAWALAARERGLFLVTSVAVATQAVLHSGFSLAQDMAHPVDGSPSATADLPMLSMGGHAHHAMQGVTDGTALPIGPDDGMPAMGMSSLAMSSTGMLAAHLLAALVCGLWLAHGEQAVFQVLRAFAGWLVAPLRLPLRLPAPPHRPRLRGRCACRARRLRQLLLVHAITSRGPPTGIAVV